MKNALKNGLKAGLVASVAAGVAVVAQPQSAEAAILAGSQIDFVGRADAEAMSVDFKELLAGVPASDELVLALGGTGSFAGLNGNLLYSVGSIKDLSPLAASANWLKFGLFNTLLDPSDDIIFSVTGITANVVAGRYDLTGVFQDGTAGIGQITTQIIGEGTRSFSGTITAVPTPALLPGLAAMGASMLRKRKKAEMAA
jgi:hypothetical protein